MSARIILWDLETSNLNANFGYILCAGWKVYGEKKVNIFKISDYNLYDKDPTNDKEVVRDMAEVLVSADIHVAHYGKWFDRTYLQSRLLHHGLDPIPNIPLVDTWKIAKDNLKLNSNRLQTITEFLQLEDKTPIRGPHWVKAMSGNKTSLNYVVKHCRQDIVVLEQVYEKLRPLMTNHPNVNIVSGSTDSCPICGTKGKLQKRGFTIARVNKKQRYQCTECGGWSHGRPIKSDGIYVR